MILEIGGGASGRLPNAIEFRFAVWRARQRLLGCQRSGRRGNECAAEGERRNYGETVPVHSRRSSVFMISTARLKRYKFSDHQMFEMSAGECPAQELWRSTGKPDGAQTPTRGLVSWDA